VPDNDDGACAPPGGPAAGPVPAFGSGVLVPAFGSGVLVPAIGSGVLVPAIGFRVPAASE